MTNLVSIDLETGDAFAYRDRNRVSGGRIDGWTDRDKFQFERGKLELFRQAPAIFRFHPSVNAFEEGRSAFRLGALRTGNPFAHCSPDHGRWDQGWLMESDSKAAG